MWNIWQCSFFKGKSIAWVFSAVFLLGVGFIGEKPLQAANLVTYLPSHPTPHHITDTITTESNLPKPLLTINIAFLLVPEESITEHVLDRAIYHYEKSIQAGLIPEAAQEEVVHYLKKQGMDRTLATYLLEEEENHPILEQCLKRLVQE